MAWLQAFEWAFHVWHDARLITDNLSRRRQLNGLQGAGHIVGGYGRPFKLRRVGHHEFVFDRSV